MEEPHYHLIGRGNCGSVWALEGHNWVIKREDGTPGRSVLNCKTMHERILQAIDTHNIPVLIPCSYNIIEAADWRWWESPHTGLALFPTHTRSHVEHIVWSVSPRCPGLFEKRSLAGTAPKIVKLLSAQTVMTKTALYDYTWAPDVRLQSQLLTDSPCAITHFA